MDRLLWISLLWLWLSGYSIIQPVSTGSKLNLSNWHRVLVLRQLFFIHRRFLENFFLFNLITIFIEE